MGEIALRPYQVEFIDNVRNQFRAGKKRVVGVAPCGAGKTIMTGEMIRLTAKNNRSAYFFVHRKELVEQTAETFKKLGIKFGIIASGVEPNYNYPVQIAMVQTLLNRLKFVPPPDLLICDECHHILADSYLAIINHWANAYLLGVTATPERTGGKRLGDVFESMVQAPTTAELIKYGNLTKFNYYDAAPKGLESALHNVGVSKGDYNNGQLEELMRRTKLVGNITDNYLKDAAGKSAICYCVNITHSKTVADAFNAAGISAAEVDGETDKNERAFLVNEFRQGRIKVLCNANLFGEGFDVPNCDAVILARPTKSLTLHVQQSMRSMRPNPSDKNKVAIIIDCVGNWKRHGVPDSVHDWSLAPNKEKGEYEPPPMKKCPECGCLNYTNQRFCTGYYPDGEKCVYEFPIDPEIIDVDIESKLLHSSDKKDDFELNRLIGIMQEAKSAKQKYWAYCQATELAESYEEILDITKKAGYKDGKAYFRAKELNLSSKKGLAKSPDLC